MICLSKLAVQVRNGPERCGSWHACTMLNKPSTWGWSTLLCPLTASRLKHLSGKSTSLAAAVHHQHSCCLSSVSRIVQLGPFNINTIYELQSVIITTIIVVVIFIVINLSNVVVVMNILRQQ